MGQIDSRGVYKYSADDTVSTWEAFLNLGMNSVSNAIGRLQMGSVYKAASIQQANSLRDRLVADGLKPSATDPILFYITTDGSFVAWDGQAWKRDGYSLASSLSVPSGAAPGGAPQTVGNNYLAGTKGEDNKLRMEAGTSVVRVPAGQSGTVTGQMPLNNRYIGIATAILSNGDPYSSGNHVVSAAAYGFTKDGDVYTSVPYKAFGQSNGNLLRINYIVVGWVK